MESDGLGLNLFGKLFVLWAWAICLTSLNLRHSVAIIVHEKKNDTANCYPN